MSENRFAKSVKAAKERTEELKEQQPQNVSEPKVDTEVKNEPVEETVKEQSVEKKEKKPSKSDSTESHSDNAILNELFPKGAKEKNFNAHSLYLSDSQWKKIQKIAKEQNISCSAVVSKILDKVL